MTKCNNCGAPLNPDAVECRYCGGAVESEPASSAKLSSASPSASGSSPQPPVTPPGWVRTADFWAGYSVAHPPNWTARCQGGVISVSQDRKGIVEAFFWPIQLPSPTNALQVAQKYLGWAKNRNPELQAWLVPTSEKFPLIVVLRISNRFAGQHIGGMVTIAVSSGGTNALITGIQGPQDLAGPRGGVRESKTLLKVVGSFCAELPTPRQRFSEPSQGSFDAVCPVGWRAEGRLRTRWKKMLLTCEYFVRKDEAGLTEVAVPGEFWRFADGPVVGLMYGGLMGMQSFAPAAKFGADLLPRHFKGHSQQRIDDVIECPEVLPRFCGDISRLGLQPQSAEITSACLVSQHLVNGTRMKQKTFFATARRGKHAGWGKGSGIWIAELMSYYHAPECEFRALEPILAGVADSFQVNQEWVQRHRAQQVQATMLLSGMMLQQMRMQTQMQAQMMQSQSYSMQHLADNRDHLTHTLHQTTDTILASGQAHSASLDHISHGWSNTIRGCTDVYDPSYGTVYSVPNDFAHDWINHSGLIIGTDSSTNPDPFSFRELLPFKF